MKGCHLFFLTAVLCAGTAFVGRAETPSVKNASFESVRENQTAENWGGEANFFVVERGTAHTGSASLRWTSDNEENYKLCGQGIKIEPDTPVEFSVWVKTDNVQNGRAAVCMEWSDKDGKYIGGSYAHGVDGTTADWQQVTGRSVVPDNARHVSITCYVTRGGTGTAWFDDVEIKTWEPPMFTGINTDRYRHITDGGPMKVRVGVSPTIYKHNLNTITDPLVVVGENLAEPIQIAADEFGKDYVGFTVDTTSLPAGKYIAAFEIEHPIDGLPAKIERPFTKVESFPERKTSIDTHRRAIVDGKPFFPLGCYFGNVQPDELEMFADSGFNCLMPYHPISREALDLCQSKNIKVIYSVKDNYPGLAVQTIEEGIEKTKAKVAEMKDHPAIFAWYINDELPLSMLDELTARRDLMEELDPDRPTWVVLYQIDEIRGYIPTFDVIGTDPYPIPSAASRAADFSRRTNDAVFHMQAVWQVPQIFNWASYKKTEAEKKNFRAPTFDEMRSMAWMSIAGGANGLVFYSWFDLRLMDKTTAEGGHALVREPFDERWAEVKKMADEITEFFPVLLAVDEPLSITAEESADGILRLYGFEGKTWTLLVNTADEARTFTLTLPEGASVAETRLGGKATQNGTSVSVDLAPLEPSFIVVEP